jgi:hypothetical protein
MTRRVVEAALGAVILGALATGSALAAQPDVFIVDNGSPESEAAHEASLSAVCGYPIDVEGGGKAVVHVFDGNPRLLEIANYELFYWFSANGKTVVVRPDAGPDVVWVGTDGHVYLAIVGRSVTGSGVIGRTVVDLTEFELVSIKGRELGDFHAWVCAALAPAAP